MKCLRFLPLFIFSSHFLCLQAHAAVGGTPVPPKVHRSIVNIKFENGMCTGTIIAPRTILSAAHCADRFGDPQFVAFVQSHKSTDKCDISEAVEFAYEPSAQPIFPLNVHSPDLLLIKIKKPLCHGLVAKLSKEKISLGDQLIMAGNGSGNNSFGHPDQIAMQVISPTLAKESVTLKNSIEKRLMENAELSYFFALPLENGSSGCHGDSGGPIFLKDKEKIHLVGANGAVLPNDSLGAEGCAMGYLQLFTPIFDYLPWIENVIKQWNKNSKFLQETD